MPIYDYICEECGDVHEKSRKYGHRLTSAICPSCSGSAHYTPAAPKLKAWIDSDKWVKNRESHMKQEQKCLKEHGTYK